MFGPLSRRTTFFALGLTVRGWCQDSSEAAAFIRQVGNELGSLVSTAPSEAERRRRVAAFIDRVVDVPGVARFCLGRFWTAATPEQQQEFIRLYRLTLVDGVGSRFGEYSGGQVKVTTSRPEVRADGIYVPTTVERPNNRPNGVVWMLQPSGSTFRITDVIVEGVSLRITQRSDYASFLARHNGDIGTLLSAMQAHSG